MVVDDEVRILRFLETRLRLEGCEVITASSSEKAFALARVAGPEIIVVDATMPGMQRFGALQKLRPFSNIPIVVTGTGSGNAKNPVPAGATAFLAKPFHPDELVALIHALLKPGAPSGLPSQSALPS
jgi:DNA-binding response OmpR family regulator